MTLPENQREIIEAHYFEGLSLRAIGEQRGVWFQGINQIKCRAIRALGRNRALCLLWAEYEAACYWHQTLAEWKHTHTSAVEAAAMKREHLSHGFGKIMRQQTHRERMAREVMQEKLRSTPRDSINVFN